ncbi:hypothetical protein L1987_32401 [Smallanthus sonchifolius]|uniref:Uncharacterized protein n=1 Tax=Smallanthus sonchifolius TaxID=185202 RepID=A0ACB9HPA7_9ASTR|nr:hypothetical protein L1987_32401 [Smallanthus sonchifolius]
MVQGESAHSPIHEESAYASRVVTSLTRAEFRAQLSSAKSTSLSVHDSTSFVDATKKKEMSEEEEGVDSHVNVEADEKVHKALQDDDNVNANDEFDFGFNDGGDFNLDDMLINDDDLFFPHIKDTSLIASVQGGKNISVNPEEYASIMNTTSVHDNSLRIFTELIHQLWNKKRPFLLWTHNQVRKMRMIELQEENLKEEWNWNKHFQLYQTLSLLINKGINLHKILQQVDPNVLNDVKYLHYHGYLLEDIGKMYVNALRELVQKLKADISAEENERNKKNKTSRKHVKEIKKNKSLVDSSHNITHEEAEMIECISFLVEKGQSLNNLAGLSLARLQAQVSDYKQDNFTDLQKIKHKKAKMILNMQRSSSRGMVYRSSHVPTLPFAEAIDAQIRYIHSFQPFTRFYYLLHSKEDIVERDTRELLRMYDLYNLKVFYIYDLIALFTMKIKCHPDGMDAATHFMRILKNLIDEGF